MHEARDVSKVTQTANPAAAYGHPVAASDNPRGEAFGNLIREGRRKRRWTQDRLVEESGVSRSTILRWEAGDASRPDPDQVRIVCLTLGIDPRRAAVALGYLTAEDLAPADGSSRRLDPTIDEVIEILQDPDVPDAEKMAWIQYLRYLRDQRRNGQQAV